MSEHANTSFLALSGVQLSAEDAERTDMLISATLEDLRSFHKFDGRVCLIGILGNVVSEPTVANFAEVDRFIDAVMDECITNSDLQDFPPVVVVPGLREREAISGARGAVDAVTHGWNRTREGLWSGEYDDVVQGVSRSFATFHSWASKYSLECSGTLPGDGSLCADIDNRRIGFISANSIFRMLGAAESDLQPVVELKQLEAALPSRSLDDWGRELDLAVLIASNSAPVSCYHELPMVGIAGTVASTEASTSEIMWLEPVKQKGSGYSLVKIVFEDRQLPRVRVRDGRAASARVAPPAKKVKAVERQSTLTPRTSLPDENEFDDALSSGRFVLLVVSGLQDRFVNVDGDPLVGPDVLVGRLLSDLGQGHLSPVPPLSEVLRRAEKDRSSTFGKILSRSLCAVDAKGATDVKVVLTAPWARVYDFTGSNSLLMAANDLDQQDPGKINFVNAHQMSPRSFSSQMDLVAMNGVVDLDDAPVTFVLPGENALDTRGLWFKQLAADLLLYPVVVVAENAASPMLSSILDIFDRIDGGRPPELPRFLVAPGGGDAVEWRLSGLKMEHFSGEVGPLVRSLLAAGSESVLRGNKVLAQLRKEEKKGTGVLLVRKLIEQAGPRSEKFIRGYEPTWGDIKSGKSAAKLHHVAKIAEASSGDERPIIVVRGTAGSGKSAALMQFAMELVKQGKVVGWIDRSATSKTIEIEAEAAVLGLDAVIVDAVEIFGMKSHKVLQKLNKGGEVLVVASLRTTRLDVFTSDESVVWVDQDDPLTDDDLKNLIKALKDNSALGKLAEVSRFPPWLRVNKLRELCDRNLLAAMVQVVTGERLESRVQSEYRELTGLRQLLYAMVSFFVYSYEEATIRKDDLIQAVANYGYTMRDAVDSINWLVKNSILVESKLRLRCRHRMVSDLLIEYLMKRPQKLAEVWEILLFHYSLKARNITDHNNPDRRNMVRFLSHSLPSRLGLPEDPTREVYTRIRELLEHDFHYWLQRASYEIDKGNLSEAASYLYVAQGCEGGHNDFMVMTASGTVTFRRAIARPGDREIGKQVLEVYEDLQAIIHEKRGKSPHTFVTLIQDGYEWIKVSQTISSDRRREIRDSLLEVAELARNYCSSNRQCMDVVARYVPKLESFSGVVTGVPL